jgi:hypothetical protein
VSGLISIQKFEELLEITVRSLERYGEPYGHYVFCGKEDGQGAVYGKAKRRGKAQLKRDAWATRIAHESMWGWENSPGLSNASVMYIFEHLLDAWTKAIQADQLCEEIWVDAESLMGVDDSFRWRCVDAEHTSGEYALGVIDALSGWGFRSSARHKFAPLWLSRRSPDGSGFWISMKRWLSADEVRGKRATTLHRMLRLPRPLEDMSMKGFFANPEAERLRLWRRLERHGLGLPVDICRVEASSVFFVDAAVEPEKGQQIIEQLVRDGYLVKTSTQLIFTENNHE